jgi:hypothetical protein
LPQSPGLSVKYRVPHRFGSSPKTIFLVPVSRNLRMSYYKGDCLDSDNESLPDESELDSGDELVMFPSRKVSGENDKKRQIIPHQTVSSPKSYLHAQN